MFTLNKGEARNALARAVFFYRLGEIRDGSFEQQRYRASGLNLLTAATCVKQWRLLAAAGLIITTATFRPAILWLHMSRKLESQRTQLKGVVGITVLGAVYFVAALLGFQFSLEGGRASPIWPAAGVALAGLLWLGPRAWTGIWLGAFAAYAIDSFVSRSVPPWTILWVSSVVASGSTIEALLGGFLCRKWLKRSARSFRHQPLLPEVNVFRFAAVALIISLVSACIGPTAFCAAGLRPWPRFPLDWLIWWFGDASGILIVTPFLLAWAQPVQIRGEPTFWGEAAAAFGLLGLTCCMIFSEALRGQPVAYLALAPLLWIAVRLGPRALVSALIFISIWALWQTIHGAGPFVGHSAFASLLNLLTFLWVASLTSMALVSTVAALQKLTGELEQRVQERTAELQRMNEALEAESVTRARAAEAARLNHERCQLIAANIPNGVVCLFDHDLRYLLADGMAMTSMGLSKEIMEGKTIWEVLPPETAELVEPHYRAALAGMAEVYEIPFANREWVVHSLPLLDPEGRVTAGMLMSQDITGQKQAEAAQRQSEELFAAFMDNLPGVASMRDREGKYVFTGGQSAAVFHKQRTDLLGKTVDDVFLPALAAQVCENSQRVLDTGRPLQSVWTVVNEEGPQHWLVNQFPILDKTGATVLVGCIKINITDRIRAEQKLKEALENEVVLRREIHHRVKNNLQVIISLLYLQGAQVTDPKMLEILRESQVRTRSIAITHELLSQSEDLTNIETGEYVRKLTTQLLSAYQINSRAIAIAIHAEKVFLNIDTALPCGLIITELVSNSLKYAFPERREGQITLDLQLDGTGLVKLIARDNGVGLTEGFDVENATSMGLRLVCDLTRQLNGVVEFRNDHGTVVTITFPNADPRKMC